jgi:hypothetical protein
MKFRTRNKAGSVVLDHHLDPSDNEYGVLGSESAHWKEIHALYSLLYGYLRITVAGQTNPRTQLDDSMLQFGPGADSALDTWLKRVGTGQLELKTDLLPVTDNSGNLGSATKRFGHVYAANYHFEHLVPDLDDTYDLGEGVTPKRWRDLYLAGAIKALANGVAVHLLPNADNTYNLGASGTRWGNLYLAGLGEIGWLNIGGTLVISNSRVLQNVTADAGIITSGQFGLGRMPRGTAGHVLEAQGASFDPMYVDPNGRYAPAGHNHAAGNITSGVLDEARCPNVYSGQVHFNGGIVTNSVNCANFSATDVVFENDFRITEAEKLGFPNGLAFLGPRGKVLMVLDGKGNLRILGRLS